MAGGIKAPSPWDSLAGPDVLGGEAFREGLLEAARTAPSELPPAARRLAPEALDALRERFSERAEGLARAYRDHGDTMRRIAEEAGPHSSSAGKIILAWEARANSTFKA